MNDPKYIFKDNAIWHQDGYQLPDDEPVMLFRGKDIGALEAICDYVDMLRDQPQNKTIVSHLESSVERLKALYLYQLKNPELQSVGCSRKSHAQSPLFLIRAAALLDDIGVAVPPPFEALELLR